MASPLKARLHSEIAAHSTTLRIILIAICLLLTAICSSPPLLAQGDTTDISADEVNEVAQHLWCPLCGGRLRLDSCELKACGQMKELIAIRLAEGEDAESIRDYFLEQYGPQVLGEPPREGFNWLAWILPVVAVVGGAIFLWTRLQEMTRPRSAAPARVAGGEIDERERRLDEELARYD